MTNHEADEAKAGAGAPATSDAIFQQIATIVDQIASDPNIGPGGAVGFAQSLELARLTKAMRDGTEGDARQVTTAEEALARIRRNRDAMKDQVEALEAAIAQKAEPTLGDQLELAIATQKWSRAFKDLIDVKRLIEEKGKDAVPILIETARALVGPTSDPWPAPAAEAGKLIHILQEADDEDPGAVMATDDAAAVPAMLEAWLERHALARFGGMGEDAKDLVRKNLAERLKLGRAGPLTPIPGGLTYTRVGLFKAPTEGAAS